MAVPGGATSGNLRITVRPRVRQPWHHIDAQETSIVDGASYMNEATYSGLLARLVYRLMLGTRYFGTKPICQSFGGTGDQPRDLIQRICVINLDRQVDRWHQIQRELGSICGRSGKPLTALASRFSAVDARHDTGLPNPEELQPVYLLANHLFVEPNPFLATDQIAKSQRVAMSRQEVAVALSHIAVWRMVAASDGLYTLVLEDDVCFRRGFPHALDRAWTELMHRYGQSDALDVLYLSYKEARTKASKRRVSDVLFRPLRGLWHLSGYVLSKRGAQKLLNLLPIHGPVDLWINHQFDKLNVFATHRSIIEQRRDVPSGNSYSILPVLSKVGVLTREKPLLFKARMLPGPVFASGKQGTGLTALAMALSMLGYRCCSDITELPVREHDNLCGKKRSRVFDAYVNVGSLSPHRLVELATLYPGARFIVTVGDEDDLPLSGSHHPKDGSDRRRLPFATDDAVASSRPLIDELRQLSKNVLVLPAQERDKWELLCDFLGCDHPSAPYPKCGDQAQRKLSLNGSQSSRNNLPAARRLRSDSSPWIAPRKNWDGIPLAEVTICSLREGEMISVSEGLDGVDSALWMLRDDTFPSNLALFSPRNVTIGSNHVARLTLRQERTPVREYTSGSICSRQRYLYGRFVAVVKPAKGPGLITGVFLHRNSPRQEIDLEFLGKDTTKLLANVYYNPGDEGTRLEYGYRGTPALIDLGFDVSSAFHRYEIEWCATSLRWRVDGRLVHERVNWDPTPVPHLPMQFNVNLWHSRSEELAGRLTDGNLPAHTEVRALEIHTQSVPVP
jgi:GR25 family glycosyltransferase involved in LPS biosynthesis